MLPPGCKQPVTTVPGALAPRTVSVTFSLRLNGSRAGETATTDVETVRRRFVISLTEGIGRGYTVYAVRWSPRLIRAG
jgi:hypothetical protein